MTDTLIDAPEWFSGPGAPAFATRAERVEYLATGAPAPLRVAAGLLLSLDAWTAPWRRVHRRAPQTASARATGPGERSATRALGLAGRAGMLADRIGRAADRLTEATSNRVDRLAEADQRMTAQIERRLAFLHPANLLRSIQAACVVIGGLAIMVAVALAPTGRSTRASVGVPTAASSATGPPGPIAGATTLVAAPPPAPTPAEAAKRGPLPVGKGMWLYQPAATEGGNAGRIVARAKAVGLTHLYVRTGSSIDGFNAAPFLDQLLPAAHASGLRVIGWDYPYLHNVGADLARAATVITYTTPDGDRLDGFAADVEPWDGTNLTPATVGAYSTALRQTAGGGYPLIACVPRPNPALTNYPFAQLLPSFDAVAPMIYWMGSEPATATRIAFADLLSFGKPIIPVGQAYDGGPDGGPRGVPSPAEIQRFITAADQLGAIGVSFWSWQSANQPAWDAIQGAPDDSALGAVPPAALTSGQIRSYQAALTSLGYPVSPSGVVDLPSRLALRAYQQAAHVGRTGALDTVTQSLLLAPVRVAGAGKG